MRAEALEQDLAGRFAEMGAVPVFAPATPEQAVAVARALVSGGLPVMEVALDAPAGLLGAAAIVREVPEALVGIAGVNDPAAARAAQDAGAAFCVSQECPADAAAWCLAHGLSFVAGAADAAQAQEAQQLGVTVVRVPADALAPVREAAESLGLLCADMAPERLGQCLAQPGVVAAEVAWVASPALLQAAQYDQVQQEAEKVVAQVVALRGPRLRDNTRA